MNELAVAFETIRRLVKESGWPSVEESTSYGTPALKVRGKLILRLSEVDTYVLPCPVEEKQFMIDMDPATYFQTPHYERYPWILARASSISEPELAEHIEKAWRKCATQKEIEAYDLSKKKASAKG